ncbi:Serine/threonine-protein kinase PLK1 [Halotydeus destructor]|nr:Serine/threonine-protein kinase PLK1 [Halotydeus destructor]
MSRKVDMMKVEIPDIVVDPNTRKKYKKGKFLGRGGFAKCFELIDLETNEIFAGKVIAKAQLQKSEQKEKMSQEISIHRAVRHKHIVEFHTYFEDKDFIYIVLELCSKRSLMEMHKRRKTLSEPEVRHFLKQIGLACLYLHENKIVHRDLKLGNLFINENMELKVGDFGLATRITSSGERKMTLCGTPNYIAPEVLLKRGHSFEVDVWSLGCIVYTLLVGRPPFETNDLKDTYKKIRHNDYNIPSNVPAEARRLIHIMLQADPTKRPSMTEILHDPYLTSNYVPSRLPTSCLTLAPRFDQGRLSIMPTEVLSPRRPLAERNYEVPKPVEVKPAEPAGSEKDRKANSNGSPDINLKELNMDIKQVIKDAPISRRLLEEAEDPASTPIFWISKWVDYTDKYGIGYQLCDNSIGVLFNDYTRIVLMADENRLQYIDRAGQEDFHAMKNYPPSMHKKITLLSYFKNYMNEHLLKTGEKANDEEEIARLPYLKNWFRTRNAIVFLLNNGTVQLNFFQDHTKIILCPLMGAVTYINEQRDFRTFKLDLLQKHGCNKELHTRLRYASEVIERLVGPKLAAKPK